MSQHHFLTQPLSTVYLSQRSWRSWHIFMTAVLILTGSFTSRAMPFGIDAAIAQTTGPAPGTIIENQATGSFVDPSDNSAQSVESNIVTITVAEVAGITVISNGYTEPTNGAVNNGDTVYFDFVITNVGNDPTQFFIPGAPSAISDGTAGPIEIIAYDADGADTGVQEDLSGNNITVPASGDTSGNLLSGVVNTNNGSVPSGGTLTVRIPVTVTGANGTNLSVTLGNTAVSPNNQNQPYTLPPTDTSNVYTVDNTKVDNGDTEGAPINGEREASDSVTVAITAPLPADYGDAPDTYSTNATNNSGEGIGASHGITANLYLGLPPDAETDASIPLDGTGDGRDEDGVAVYAMTEGATGHIVSKSDIFVTNTTGQDATLHGWIDFNKDGVFSSAEHTSIVIANGAITVHPAADLIWNGVTVGTAGSTYARFRLTTDEDITANTPGGAANDGEVEDYEIAIAPSPPTQAGGFCSSPYSMVYSGHFPNRIDAVHLESGAFVALTTATSANITNSLASDHINNLVYYAENSSVYAWSPINNTHTTITNNFNSLISGSVDLSSGGAAFYNGSLYLGVDDNPNTSDSESEVYRVDFVPGSSGLSIQSVTSLNLNGVTAGTDWGDMTIDSNGVMLASGGGIFWTYDLNNGTYTALSSSLPGDQHQLAKDGQGRLWAMVYTPTMFVVQAEVVGNTIQPVGSIISIAPHDTNDGSECVIGESSIGDRIWRDTNSDGVQDPGENGIANVTVDLYWDIDGDGQIDAGDDPILATQTTGTGGNYDFFDLIFGNYIVKVTDTNGVLTGSSLTSASDTLSVNIPPGIVDYNDADFGYHAIAVGTPNVLLVKRITAINRGLANEQIFDNSYIDVGTPNDNDNAINWPGGTTVATMGGGTVESYLPGITGVDDATAVANVAVRPGDEIEYTISFLSDGEVPAQNVLLCDRIPANTTFVGNAFNDLIPAGTGGGNRGILLNFNSAEVALTNTHDGDEISNTGTNDSVGGYYFPAGLEPSVTLSGINCGGTNNNGAIVVDLSNILHATGEGTPTNAYGFIRFRVAVD